jgi:hypothetical protein
MIIELVPDRNAEVKCQDCGALMVRGLSNVADPITLEKKDPWRNKQVIKNMDSILKARSKKHFTEFEAKGLTDKWGEGHARLSGWVKKGKVRKFEDFT